MKSFDGYLKKKLGDSYVLLAGGGEKQLDDFFLKAVGGTVSAATTFSGELYAKHLSIGYPTGTYSWGRAEMDFITEADDATDLWMGVNKERKWNFSVRNSSTSYKLVLFNQDVSEKFSWLQDGTFNAVKLTGNLDWSYITNKPTSIQDAQTAKFLYLIDNPRSTNIDITPASIGKDGMQLSLVSSSQTGGTAPPYRTSKDGPLLTLTWDGDSWGDQLHFGMREADDMHWRAFEDGTYKSWKTILDSSNYVSYLNTSIVNYYWADQKISTQSLTTTEPTVKALHIFPGGGNYNDGIRIHSRNTGNGWCAITFCASDNTGKGGQTANSWYTGVQYGNFYIGKGGTGSGSEHHLRSVNDAWECSGTWTQLSSMTVKGKLTGEAEVYFPLHVAIGENLSTYQNTRAELDLVTHGNDAADFWMGTNATRQWVLTPRPNGDIFLNNTHDSSNTPLYISKAGNAGIGSYRSNYRFNVDGTAYFGNGSSSSGYNNIITLYHNAYPSQTSENTAYNGEAAWGMSFDRGWSSNNSTNSAGIYAYGGGSWSCGLVFRVKSPGNYNTGHNVTALDLMENGIVKAPYGFLGNLTGDVTGTATGNVTALSINGNYLRWTKNGSNYDLTIPYATTSYYATEWQRTWQRGHNCLADTIAYHNATHVYMYDSDSTNSPSGGAGYIISHTWDWGNGTSLLAQTFDPGDGDKGRLYTNTKPCGSDTWVGWKKIAYVSEIPTVTNYYWANIKISASSQTNTSPTFNHVAIGANLSSYSSDRAELDVVSSGTNTPCDIWLGSNGTRCWYISCRGNNESNNLLWGRTAGSGTCQFGYNLYAPNYYTSSDRSKKKNISSFSEHIRKFQLKDTEKWHYGVIAQEVPEMFRDGEEGNMTVNYNSVLSYYVGELENRVKDLEDKLKKYEEIQNI